ncbi:MAG: hypothetical protein PHR11_06675, partial [Candidatus Omnitrophica bacterium]|nr:hypothetical protein [Candidatus Omnitrophota bacterium]
MSYCVPGKRSFTVICCALCCLGLAAALPLSAAAQEEEASAAWECDVYSRYEPARSAKASEGDVELFESGAEVSLEKKFFGRLPVTFSVASEYMGIDETTTLGLPSHLTGVSFDAETTLPFSLVDKTYLRVGITPSFYGDDWDYGSSAFRIPVRAFLIHLPNERLTLLAGVAVYPDYENEVMPILGFIYKPNDRL